MPAFLLPLAPGETPHIDPAMAEQLAALLAPVNDPSIQSRLGQEREISRWAGPLGEGLVTEGERFARPGGGWLQGQRYLLRDQGQAVAVVNVTLHRQGGRTEARVSNVFVAPSHRRQGLAHALLRQAQAHHPRLVADSSFSAAGAALVGADRPAPTRRRRPR